MISIERADNATIALLAAAGLSAEARIVIVARTAPTVRQPATPSNRTFGCAEATAAARPLSAG